MDYKELIEMLREYGNGIELCNKNIVRGMELCVCAATSIETLLAEKEEAIKDLTELGRESPDSCHLCKHLPCTEKYGRCIGWEWRGPTPPDQQPKGDD